MKKFVLVLGVISLSFASFAIPGYKMKEEACPGGGTYDVCRESPGDECWISEQTVCDENPD
ncbi:hypothetical protein [Belliella aquatica]|uniref:Uncharacterized protein n=1 Tax=Belliella aquatica TaxID=1323734 RepID=A0ABQ1MNE2_9BACT|nr:hypothetical protein [Belliella aquatica]MCH7405412.1 hypothetical protein [Belliella aquatica]GGC41882.1 hypothetical protein GCM10010993_20540 [Belliella aquatica]